MSNAFASLRVPGIVLLLLFSAVAQAQDWHIFSGNLFAKSAFAHGYIHGYEQGFHNGDVDLQMGREFREVKNQNEYKKVSGFREEYGDKKVFEDGYRAGFLVGYTDCFSGRTFRAAQLLDATVQKQDHGKANLHIDRGYDHAFRRGYEMGQRQGLADGRVSAVSRMDGSVCEPSTGRGDDKAEYCDAFREGYRLGYSDVFANQHDWGEVFARNRGK